MRTLRRYLTRLKADRLQHGQGEPERLFTKADGTLMDKDHVAYVFGQILKRAGRAPHRVYDCRTRSRAASSPKGLRSPTSARNLATPTSHDAPLLREVGAESWQAVGRRLGSEGQPGELGTRNCNRQKGDDRKYLS